MKIFGNPDEKTMAQFRDVSSRAVDAALMADAHVGFTMPIGGVAAYDQQVSVVGVGFDIACGNAAIRTDMTLRDLGKWPDKQRFMLERVADRIRDTISFGVGRKNAADDAPTDDPLFEVGDWFRLRERAGHGLARQIKDKARAQLGTVGSGNHYVDVFVDEAGRIWVGVHFGSRGLGHSIASGFLALSQGQEWGSRAREVEVLLDINEATGHDYWHLMSLAGRYAYAGREWVARKVVSILGGTEIELVHNHHNFAWREEHGGEELVVIRKGATPAFPGQLGFIGGSMGDDAVIVRGTESGDAELQQVQRDALFSTVHGAGRVMSRTRAAGGRKGKQRFRGEISQGMMEKWVREKGVILRGGGVDESPHVYRRLPEVLGAQGDTVEVLHTLRPLVVVMAGANEFDPYKD